MSTPDAAWFNQARFGMFIHWGVYAVPARGEWVMNQEKVPPAEYAGLARRFNPRRYDPHAWAALARAAGMKYMVLTTRHHDGYSLFDSRVSDFTAPKTAAGRDLELRVRRAVWNLPAPPGYPELAETAEETAPIADMRKAFGGP